MHGCFHSGSKVCEGQCEDSYIGTQSIDIFLRLRTWKRVVIPSLIGPLIQLSETMSIIFIVTFVFCLTDN